MTVTEPGLLSEDRVKAILRDWLASEGWQSTIAWGHSQGPDILADRGQERWLIEVKGSGSRPQMRVNYFLAVLGELLQRMDKPETRYSIALPDMPQYRGLWQRLPPLAKARLTLTLILVKSDGSIQLLP